jgi:hypothetical protein
VQIAAYVEPGLRMAIRIAARAEGVSQSLFIQQAVESVLADRYETPQAKAKAQSRKELVNA